MLSKEKINNIQSTIPNSIEILLPSNIEIGSNDKFFLVSDSSFPSLFI